MVLTVSVPCSRTANPAIPASTTQAMPPATHEKVTPVAGHRRLDAVEFRPSGVQLVARLDDSRGAAIEVLIHPVP